MGLFWETIFGTILGTIFVSILGTIFRRENPHTQTQKQYNRLDYFIVLCSSTTIHTSPPIFLPFFPIHFFLSRVTKISQKISVKNFVLDVLLKWFWGDEKGTTFNEVFLTLIYRTFQKPKPSLFFAVAPKIVLFVKDTSDLKILIQSNVFCHFIPHKEFLVLLLKGGEL